MQKQSPYVTVALLHPLTSTATSALTKTELLEQLEGAYIAQHRINHTLVVGDSRPPIKLVLANEGSTENQWRPVVDQLVEMARPGNGQLVAVVGMGISICQTEQTARELSKHSIPMVGAVISGTGLEYSKISGLIRVSPDNVFYAEIVHDYLKRYTAFNSAILVYDINSDSNCDLFTKTLREALKDKMGDMINSRDESYRGGGLNKNAGASEFAAITPNICAARPDVVLYAGRRGDLRGFLDALENRVCRTTPITVIAAGIEPTAVLLGQEKQLHDANLAVVSVARTDAESWDVSGAPEHYPDFRLAFTESKFNTMHLIDDRVMMMHDALLTAAKAIRLAAPESSRPGVPTAAEVFGQLMNLHGINTVPGASGTFSFSYREPGAGNPQGKPMLVTKFPSPPPHTYQQVGPPYTTP